MAESRAPASSPIANPAPLGLAGFALTTTLLSADNAGLIHSGGLLFLGMALFYGGLAQFCAGMWEMRKGNTFAATAFSSYGAFWMGLGILEVFDNVAKAATIGHEGLIWFLFLWTIFTGYMFVASLRTNGAIMAVFLALTLTFAALWIGALRSDAAGSGFTNIGGWLGILTAALAFYTSFADVVNDTFGREVLPVFAGAAAAARNQVGTAVPIG